MQDPSNVNRNLCPSFDVTTHLTDNDPNTYWIAATYTQNSNITYTFRTTYDMNYLLVVPYLDATYKIRIANYTFTLKGEDGEILATYYRDGVNITGSNYYILPFPETKGVKSVTVALGEKAGGPRVSISEIAFYNRDTLPEEIANLFTDGTFTALKGSVDQETVTALTTRQNIRYMRMFAGAFMYAAGNHIGVEYGSTSALVQGKPTSATGKGNANGLFGWGIAHEIGHNMDKLGNLGSEAKSNEVRVAYDKTISSDLYDLSRQDGTITITMKNGASVPVTGIKVTGTGLSGQYTVKVKANAGADWTTAKTGTLSDDTVVAYFTKPGAAESDTRIWTYDAAVLEITGIPEDATVSCWTTPPTARSATPATASLSSCPTWRRKRSSTPRAASPMTIPWRPVRCSTVLTIPTMLRASALPVRPRGSASPGRTTCL